MATGTRTHTAKFRDAVRARDCGCIITGTEAEDADVGDWMAFHAAHIFPLGHESHWIDNNYDRWITVPAVRGESINSVQNGLLLRKDIRSLFDTYGLSINPDVRLSMFIFEAAAVNGFFRTNIKSLFSKVIYSKSQAIILIKKH